MGMNPARPGAATAARTDEGGPSPDRGWWAVGAAVGALLLATVVLGVVAIVQNERVLSVTSRALAYDVEVEDEGDDVRVAVLDLRHFHRNIAFEGPSDHALADFDQGYANWLDELDELEALGITDASVPTADELRAMGERYYTRFRPAIALYESDRAAFNEASAEGLRAIAALDQAALRLDNLGERLAEASLQRVAAASGNERMMLIGMLAGAMLAGAGLAVAAARAVGGLRAAWGREQAVAGELARALRLKTDFVADASHELRTPLTVIRGNAEVGLAATDEPARREVLSEIATEAARMNELVDDLLFLARSDAGAPPMEREFLPARLLLNRVAAPAETLVRGWGARFVADVAAEGYLEADPARIQQAVLNLIDNAAKHAPPDSDVVMRVRSADGVLRIAVIDRGPGIPADELPMVFERYYQVGPRRTRKTHGAGLGLAIARTIAHAHGGEIEAESAPGRGTTMTIRLPLCPPAADAADAAAPPSPGVVRRPGPRAWLAIGQ